MEQTDQQFEKAWQMHKHRLLMEDREYKEAVGTYEMKSGADWLLFGIPVAAGIVSVEYMPISHELLRWIVSILITIVVFAVCVYIKSLSNPHRAISDIEADVKQRAYQKYIETGELPSSSTQR